MVTVRQPARNRDSSSSVEDPDIPIESVERDAPTGMRAQSRGQRAIGTGDLAEQLGGVRLDNRTPTATDTRNRTTSTPSIQLSPTPAEPEDNGTQNNRANSIAAGINALNLTNTPGTPTNNLSTESFRGNADSPSPSPRRARSASRTIPTIQTHQVEDEAPPQSLFYDTEIQAALARAKEAAKTMSEALGSSNLHREQGSTIYQLHSRALRLASFQPPSSRIVGLVGDSGVGKSSLINSLLDRLNFARSSSRGTACTCVVTEYHYHASDELAIEVEYFSIEALKRQFDDLLRAYRSFHYPGNDVEPEELEALKPKAELATYTFQAAFGSQFADSPRVRRSAPVDDAVDTMLGWARNILPAHVVDQPISPREHFPSIANCSNRLQALTSEIEGSPQARLWPFIRKLRVFLNAPILGKGLIIADLPGLRDLNAARQNITERYVRECHQIFVVVDIRRAVTNVIVKEALDLASRASLSNIGIVCTMADLTNINEAKTDFPAEASRISALERELNGAKQDRETVEAEIEDIRASGIRNVDADRELNDLYEELRTYEQVAKRCELDLVRHIITTRNRRVSRDLLRKYRDHPLVGNLRIFPVGNDMYHKNRNKQVDVALSWLQLSGIIDLRRHCIGIVAESHLRATLNYIKDDIPAFLGSVDLWIEAGSGNSSAERKEKMLEVVASVQDKVNELTSPVSTVNTFSRLAKSDFNNKISAPMWTHARQWGNAAGRAAYEWSSWHHSTYSAFCRNYGDYATASMRHHCWNEIAIVTMNSDMEDPWQEFVNDIDDYLLELKQGVETVFEEIIHTTTIQARTVNGAGGSLQTLITTLRHRSDLLDFAIDVAFDEFRSQLVALEVDVFQPIRSAIIGRLMENSYRAANCESGRGSDARRKGLIEGGFSSPTLFSSHRTLSKEQLYGLADTFQITIRDIVAREIAVIETDLDTLRNDNIIQEAERNPGFRQDLADSTQEVKATMEVVNAAVNILTN